MGHVGVHWLGVVVRARDDRQYYSDPTHTIARCLVLGCYLWRACRVAPILSKVAKRQDIAGSPEFGNDCLPKPPSREAPYPFFYRANSGLAAGYGKLPIGRRIGRSEKSYCSCQAIALATAWYLALCQSVLINKRLATSRC